MKNFESTKVVLIMAISLLGFGLQGYRITSLQVSNASSVARLNEVEAKIDSLISNAEDAKTTIRALEINMINSSNATSPSTPFTRDGGGWWVADDAMFRFPKGIVVGVKNPRCTYGEATLSVNGLRHILANCPEGVGSVTFGHENTASGENSSVLGGKGNIASGITASVLAGFRNTAVGDFSTVSGGSANHATGIKSTVSGGLKNHATTSNTSVSGGEKNNAIGMAASVSGGFRNTAKGGHASTTGGSYNDANGRYSSVTGGLDNTVDGYGSSIAGGYKNRAVAQRSIVVGNRLKKALKAFDVIF
uniref:Peptidase S74 domain-containing protein n=2 Tax=Corethron hystrix TaxID=216773 RepID=A0A7S1FTJ0_9STRA|mmetsp:Transcript_30656/g.70174  ORF Transcript_30656/g.70174 Transcript_30656/m.70174 type:complete len:305 (+) Transcript_30656:278-1192(+)